MMKYVALAARVCLCLIFLKAGISHLLGFGQTVAMMAGNGLPIPNVLLAFTVIFQILGGLSLLLGYQVRIGSILLIIFLIPATLVFHNPIADPSQLNDFLKNIGLIGGLLMVIAVGAGALSIDGDKITTTSNPRTENFTS
ncbi:DoxX family protein [Myxosarcina sp. GI1]|uniref:DoxX family protein n=1 Tax=Myxosarcina sp. GI1 TaxID=1541065 RepID=UPI003527E003